MNRNLTSGSTVKCLLMFSLPYLFSYFLQTLYGMADLIIVGKLDGVAGTTAVSVGSQIMHMLTVIIVGLAMGTTVGIGKSVGAGDGRRAAKYIGNSAVLFAAISVVLAGVLIVLVRPIVSLMSTPADAAAGTAAYLRICFAGIPFITAYNIISSVFRGMGDSKTPMYFIAVACSVNIGLDFLFVGAFDLGPAGAALGTVLSQAVSVAVSLIFVRRRHDIGLCKEDLCPSGGIIGKILRVGAPIAVQDGLIQVSFAIITIIANRRGLSDAAAVGIVEKIIGFLFLVPSSMLSSVSALGAINIGAEKPRRARRTLYCAMAIAAGFGLAVSALMQFTAEGAVTLFTDTSADGADEVIRLGGQYLRGYIWDCTFAGVHFSFSGYFCAVGRSELSFMHNIAAIVLVRIPGAYMTSKLFPQTLFPMGLATAAGSLLSVIICIAAYALLRRKDNKIA